MTIAVIWQRFGPYHLARLQGAARVLRGYGLECTGIEVAGHDQYAWDAVSSTNVTLFPESRYEHLSGGQIRRAVVDQLQQLDPAAVAVNGWSVPEALAAIQWCRRHRRPAILMSETHEPSGRWWKESLKRRRVARCRAALVGGRRQADYLRSLGFPETRIVCGYDAVDNEHFQRGAMAARQDAAQLQARYALPTRYFYANTRFLPRKNIDGLLQAYARYREFVSEQERDAGQAWELVISGSGRMEQPWRALASQLGLAETVYWPGFVQYGELPAYYGLASAFVHPAHREAWGLVLNEAAAAGLPLIVGSRVGAACELVAEGENGYLVDTRDVRSLTDAMVRISTLDDRQRAAMGQRSRELVARFAPEQFGEALWCAMQLAQHSSADCG